MTPVEALQKALAAEHAAVFLYGLLGSRTSASRQPALAAALSRAFADHRDQRDALTVMISATGQDPVALWSTTSPRAGGHARGGGRRRANAGQRLTRTYGEAGGQKPPAATAPGLSLP